MIGLLGLGSHSTLYYIEKLNHQYNCINGGYSTCPLKLLNTNFDKINPYLPCEFEPLIPVVKKYIEDLNSLNVSKILIPNITLFETIDQIDFNTEILNKIIHPIKIMRESLKHLNEKDVIILGSKYTMTSNYVSSFTPNKISLLSEDEYLKIENIRNKVFHEGVSNDHVDYLVSISNKYYDKIIVIACSELSIINSRLPISKNKIDLVQLQFEELIFKVNKGILKR